MVAGGDVCLVTYTKNICFPTPEKHAELELSKNFVELSNCKLA